jgi:sulfate adenylyltransferase subunit 2
MLILVDDDRLNLFPGEKIEIMKVRFRTLGCYPLTGAIASDADSLPKILLELFEAKTSERQGRAIDNDSSSSMEKKKKEGYF